MASRTSSKSSLSSDYIPLSSLSSVSLSSDFTDEQVSAISLVIKKTGNAALDKVLNQYMVAQVVRVNALAEYHRVTAFRQNDTPAKAELTKINARLKALDLDIRTCSGLSS